MRKLAIVGYTFILLGVLMGCTPTQPIREPLSSNTMQTLRDGRIPNGQARICMQLGVLNSGGIFGIKHESKMPTIFKINGVEIGSVYPNEAIVVDLYPGTYQFSWVAVNEHDKDVFVVTPLSMTVENGSFYNIKANHYMNMGLGGIIGAIAGNYTGSLDAIPSSIASCPSGLNVITYNTKLKDSLKSNIQPVASEPTNSKVEQKNETMINSGSPTEANGDKSTQILMDKLSALLEMKNKGLITEDEYNKKRQSLLEKY